MSGILFDTEEGVKFRPQSDPAPIHFFPLRKGEDPRGAVVINEAPVKIDGKVPENLYIIVHDPYAHDKTTGVSLGSAYVMKRTNNFSSTYNDCIVASYIGRPDTLDEYNRNLFLLARYYNAKIGFENDRGDVISYAKRFKLTSWLTEEFKIMHKKELSSDAVNRPYGMHMTPARKEMGEAYLRDWLNQTLGKDEIGNPVKILHTITDIALLQEFLKFSHKGNFDRVMSLMIGMYHLKELTHATVVAKKEKKHADFFGRQLY